MALEANLVYRSAKERASEDLPWVARRRLMDSAIDAASGVMEGVRWLERMR